MPATSDLMKKKASVFSKGRKKREVEIAEATSQKATTADQKEKSSQLQQTPEENSAVLDSQPEKITAPQKAETSAISASGSRPVGRPAAGRTSQMTVMMDPELKKRLKKFCIDEGKSAAAVIDELVRELLDRT